MTLAVEMGGISRRFGTVQALENVDLNVRQGEIHALVGENGAGKTTLMRMLFGADQPDLGEIRVFGEPVAFHRASDGIAAGIGMVSQHYSIIPEISCLENLMLGAEGSWLIRRGEAGKRAESLASQMGFEFDWSSPAERLSPAGAQKLEILKLLWRNARIMILDEPTAMLSPSDSDALFASLKQLVSEGATVIVVTHRLPEVLEHADRVTVLRGGKLIETRDVAGTTSSQLAELIVGKSVASSERQSTSLPHVALRVKDLVVKGYRGDDALTGISFDIHEGEILGIAGVDGSGQRELIWSLMGLLRPTHGNIELHDMDIAQSSPADRLQHGIRIIPEDRHSEGVIEDWSLEENSSIGLQRTESFSSGMWLKFADRRSHANHIAERFSTKHGGLDEPMLSLSGGNQQRIVAARALFDSPKLILAFQPARGLDIEATRQVYEGIGEACAKGACALVVSFDLDELIENCDRVVALNRGKLYDPGAELSRDRQTIGELMVSTT